MKQDVFLSNLPIFEKHDDMTFWQSMGIASSIISCHSVYSLLSVENLFLSFRSALERKQVVILFNEESRPVAFATYFLADNIDGNYSENNQLEIESESLIFEHIVSPFSCPLHFYRFLKQHFEKLNLLHDKAYLFKESENSFRKIW